MQEQFSEAVHPTGTGALGTRTGDFDGFHIITIVFAHYNDYNIYHTKGEYWWATFL